MAENIIIFGAESEFMGSGLGAGYMDLALLDDPNFVVAYRDIDDSDRGKAKIGIIDGTGIAFGNEAEFNTGYANFVNVDTLSSSGIVVAHRDQDDLNYGKAAIGIISGTTITFGSEVEFLSDAANYVSIAAFSSSGFVIAYQDSNDSNDGDARIGTVSGTDITFGTPSEFGPAASRIDVAVLSENKFVVIYTDSTTTSGQFNTGAAKIGDISGTNIVFGSKYQFLNYNQTIEMAVTILSPTKFVVIYEDQNDFNRGKAKIGTVAGTTITFGPEAEFESDIVGVSNLRLTTISTDKFVLTYRDENNSNYGTARVGTVSGTTITFNEEYEFNSAGSFYNPIITLDTSTVIVAYRDQGDSDHGTARVGTIFSDISTSGDLFIHGYNPFAASGDLYIRVPESAVKQSDLYISAPDSASGVASINLFVNGLEPESALSCPTLDPTASIQIQDSLITTYQSQIDALINQLGKNVLLEFDPIRSPCPNCEYDVIRKRSIGIYIVGGPRPFARGRKCPYCKGRGLIETAVNKCIKCLIKWNPYDAKNYGIAVTQKNGVVRLKTFLTEADDLARTKTIIVNHDIVSAMKLRVKLIQGPISTGLREDRYCISFWELI